MEIKITIPNDKKDEVTDAFASQYDYQEEVVNPDYDSSDEESLAMIPNPETKERFLLVQIRDFIKNVYVANQVKTFNEGQNSVRTTAKADMDDVTIV